MPHSVNIRSFLNGLRHRLALLLLVSEKTTVTQIAYRLGYSSLYHFSEQFFKTFRFRPSRWKENIRQ